jgi:hypothetical protein
MGLNAQTSVPDFTAGQILTAAQMTEVNTGIPVFADTTARDAAFGGTGEKTLAEGQFAYIEATNATQFYDGAAWQVANGGLVRVGGGALSGSSVAFTNVFSATYDNYLVVVSDLSAAGAFWMTVQLGATTSGYYSSSNFAVYSAVSTFNEVVYGNANGGAGAFLLGNPFLAKNTTCQSIGTPMVTGGAGNLFSGFLNNTTSYTGFTVAGSTFTGGSVNIYGYSLS